MAVFKSEFIIIKWTDTQSGRWRKRYFPRHREQEARSFFHKKRTDKGAKNVQVGLGDVPRPR